ncbi:putative ABC transporter ATP-binding protein YxlF [Clostridium puniceum]|uniref:Putative ABC transporter ATP-binding protein YxlF n=1 Tax=Clostridium puniceum TaxID=29367 RepID=A0A1S8TXZ2_9CLOT|nr:ATP-binding cassette domain-containing protein [Clostridium puniceum]OOM82611.1 putative ABC transporter ATP-binding protein YxlF [Clostridium puniceum]
MTIILKVNELTKMYKNGRGIKNISFEIEKGDIFGLLGPNGSGKTTTMKIITGLSYADKGSVQILGINFSEESSKALKEMACLIESPAIYDYLTARENLKLAANYYTEIKTPRIDDMLMQTGLIKYANEKVKNFSLGMKQRLGLALALVSNPKLVILDEPTNGMDVEGTVDIREIIIKQAKLGITFLVSSHISHEIELMCNKVGIMKEGTLLNVTLIKNALDECETLEKYFLKQIRRKEEEV